MPHAIVFLNEEDINSVIIVAGTDLNFVLNDVKEAWEVILKLIAVYYIFDLQYPAAYGLLNRLNLVVYRIWDRLYTKKHNRLHLFDSTKTGWIASFVPYYKVFGFGSPQNHIFF